MNETDALFDRAVELHRDGHTADALALYDAVIASDPQMGSAHFNRGLALQALNRTDEALQSFDRAIRLDPGKGDAHYCKGVALKQMNRLDEAVESYDRAIALMPDFAPACFDRANALRRLNRCDEALRGYDQAIALNPDFAEAYNSKGAMLQELERFTEACQCFDRVIALKPDHAGAYNNKANTLAGLGRLDEALQCCDQAIARNPDFAEAYSNKGNFLRSLKRQEEALACYDQAIAINPDLAEAHNNKGTALRSLGRFREALRCYDRAIALKPDYADAYCNRGNALFHFKRFAEAVESFDRAAALKPDDAETHWNKSLYKLLVGDVEEGWALYEWRKKKPNPVGVSGRPQPCWSGKESLEGKTLFIHAEQGLGDTIQFSRYALLAKTKAARVILVVPNGLVRLLGSLDPDIIIEGPSTVAAFDYQIALMSMPLAFKTTLSTCPAPVPYLRAEPDRVKMWKERLGSDGFKIGICWQGNKQGDIDMGRSFLLRHFEGIARLPNVRLISLQKNEGVEQLNDLPAGMTVETLGDDFDAGPDAFIDTAAVMECLDLIITPDTAMAHLAGALGRPAWVALKYVPDWRWLLERSDSPWYPTLRLFRQRALDDWSSVFAAIEAQLRERLGVAPQGRLPASVHPTKTDDLFDRAVEHHRQGRMTEALAMYDAVIASEPQRGSAHFNRGLVLQSLNKANDALHSFDRVIQCEPDHAEAYCSRGNALTCLNRMAEAIASYDRAIALNPRFGRAYGEKGLALTGIGRPEEAFACFDRAAEVMPDNPVAHSNKGSALVALERPQEALQCYDRALAIDPDGAYAHLGRGNALLALGRPQDALRSYEKAIALKPDYAEAYYAKSMCLLQLGDWGAGWPPHEWRKKSAMGGKFACHADIGWMSRESLQMEWSGEKSLEGKTLFIHAEQGLGDTIQFCRYALLAKEKAAHVILAVPDVLMRLLKSLDPAIAIERMSTAVAFDYHVALMSMPLAFGTTVNTCPAQVPYLRAEPDKVKLWKERLGSEGFKIGICWHGNKQAMLNRWRSFPLRYLEPISKLRNVRLISLQKNDGVEQLNDLPAGMKVETLGNNFDAGPDAFIDTAAVMECLDLVITPDTAMAHLAGALGRPAWVALKYVSDWRWLLDRSDSPWYPTMKLFRQPAPGDWASVFAVIQAQLSERLG